MLEMFTGLKWQAWATLTSIALLAIAGAFGGGVALGWANRDELAKAQRAAAVARADAATAHIQANTNAHAGELAARTATANEATHRAEARGRQEIANAVQEADFDRLDAAWRNARDSVWRDAGLAPAPGRDPAELEPSPSVRAGARA